MKTAKEIADALVSAPDLSEDLLEALDVYRAAKRQTGAPCALESALSRAAHDCIRHRDDLRQCLADAAWRLQKKGPRPRRTAWSGRRRSGVRRAAWERLPAKEVQRQARARGMDEGRGKASLVDRLVTAGLAPDGDS